MHDLIVGVLGVLGAVCFLFGLTWPLYVIQELRNR
jgi:hypothetical protein